MQNKQFTSPPLASRHKIIIGIDCGTETGVAIWSRERRQLLQISTLRIHKAMEEVRLWNARHGQGNVFIRVEDARQRSWFGKTGIEVWKGAGSICRDSRIWEDFLTDEGIPFELVAPKNNRTKLSQQSFTRLTGWSRSTNEHSRDAAMLCYGY